MLIRSSKWPCRPLISGLLAAILLNSANAIANPGAGEGFWLQDPISSCSLWTHRAPASGELPSWSGGCEQGRADGEGVLSWFADQQLWGRYHGSMKAGRVVGFGDLWIRADRGKSPGYDHYQGVFEGGRLTGQVVLQRANGDRFEGAVRNGQMEGYGSYLAVNGDRYDGEFHNGVPDGQGYSVSTGGEHYHGRFKAGKRDGEGALVEANGDRYSGPFVDGRAQGRGRFEAADGGVYVGEFVAGKPQGQGMYTAADGKVYRGHFAAGRPQGVIEVTSPSGEVSEQQWRGGERVATGQQP